MSCMCVFKWRAIILLYSWLLSCDCHFLFLQVKMKIIMEICRLLSVNLTHTHHHYRVSRHHFTNSTWSQNEKNKTFLFFCFISLFIKITSFKWQSVVSVRLGFVLLLPTTTTSPHISTSSVQIQIEPFEQCAMLASHLPLVSFSAPTKKKIIL